TLLVYILFFFSSRRRHTRFSRDWSSDVCSSDLKICALLAITSKPPRTDNEQTTVMLAITTTIGVFVIKFPTINSPYSLKMSPFEIGRASCRERVYMVEIQESYNKV